MTPTGLSTLRDPTTWTKRLGLLPMPLAAHGTPDAFVLLNGARGNFCLDLRAVDEVSGRQDVWSADLAYRVVLSGNDVLVSRWDERARSVRYSAGEVVDHFERFHRYLERQSPPQAHSVVAHALTVFRRLRTALGVEFSGEQGLRAFLTLLASATDRTDLGALSLENWGLDDADRDVAAQLTSGQWSLLDEELRAGRRMDDLTPRLPLMLRHASGRLFQEAHYAAVLTSTQQLLLDGFAPDPAEIQPGSNAIGLHFTPSPLARTLVEEVLQELPRPLPVELHVFDPACGSGEFLREFMRQLVLLDFAGTLRVTGFDISSGAAAMSRFALALEKQSVSFQTHIRIVETDALVGDVPWPTDVSAVLMNPPFQSWRDMSPALQSRTRDLLGPECAGARPDLAFAFLRSAVAALGEDGSVGAILPASFLDGTSASALRGELKELIHPRLLARLGSQGIFHDATVDPCLLVATRGGTERSPIAFWSDHRPSSTSAALRALRRTRGVPSDGAVIETQDGFSIYRNPELGHTAGSWAPRPYEQWRLLQKVREGAHKRVSDMFDVRQGVITGLNKVFLQRSASVKALPPDEARFFRPAVLNESFVAGRLRDVAYVFYPYGSASIASEDELRDVVPTFYETILAPNRDALLARKRITPNTWWLLSEHRAWQEESRPKLVTAYFGDAGSFAWDELGDRVIVQGYAWLPKKPDMWSRRVWLAYLALTNSQVMSSLLAASSNNVGGGQWNMSKRFVSSIPLVKLYGRGAARTLVDELAVLGEQIYQGTFRWDDAESQNTLKEFAEAALGISDPRR
jgi:adenine-specific DNA-methyltransferase